jgi:hypothetical protein
MEMLFVSAFGLSLALWAVPGAVTTEALRRGLTRRWWSVSFLLLGTLAGDALWASVSFLFAASLAWVSLKEGWGKRHAPARETSTRGGRDDRCPALSAESVYDHFLARGQSDGLCGERFELAGARHGHLFLRISVGRCGVGAVLVRRGAVRAPVRWPGAFPLDEHWVRPGAWLLWPQCVRQPVYLTPGIVGGSGIEGRAGNFDREYSS